MALSDAKLRTLKPRETLYALSDGDGLFIEVAPAGSKVWRLRYRLGGKQEKATLGAYPQFSLADARRWTADCRALVARGLSPMALKRGDPVPPGASAAARELAVAFVRDWGVKRRGGAGQPADTVEAVARRWFSEIVSLRVADPRNTLRVLEKDVLPAIGAKPVAEVSVADVMAVVDRVKARGAGQMALQTRNIIKRLFGFAIARQQATFNPAAALEARYIATARSRDVALSSDEVGRLLRGIYTSDMRRSHKLALHLLVVTMVRKSELIDARWEEIEFDAALWTIPASRMKQDRAHLVPLSAQAVAMFEELRALASGSAFVFPSSRTLYRPISHSTLNAAVRAVGAEVRDFVIHDFRRTASTHLHEAGFASDWIEKALAHETLGIRGVYNKALYLDQRREMLQWWADFVESQIEDGRKVLLGRFGRGR